MPINSRLSEGVVLPPLVVAGITVEREYPGAQVFPLDSIVYAKKHKKRFATPRRAIARSGFIGWLTVGNVQYNVRCTGTVWVEVLPNWEKRRLRAETRERELDQRFPSRVHCQAC